MPGLLIDKKELEKYDISFPHISHDNETHKNDTGIVFLINSTIFDEINKLQNGYQRISYIKSPEFSDSIYAHYHIFYNKKKKICEIRGYIKNPQHLKDVVNSISDYLPKDVTIWTGIVPSKGTDKYIRLGFNHPYICNKSPLNHSFKTSGIAFVKENNKNIENRESVLNKLAYITKNKNTLSCEIYAKFTPEAIKYLKTLNDTTKTDNELSGSLTVSKVDNKNGKIIFELSADPNSVIHGAEEEVDAVWSRYNFHTHPKKAYVNNGVERGWPSSQDYVGFIKLKNHTIFHTVVTIEGVYIISFRPEWIDNISKIDTKYVLNHYDVNKKDKISFDNYVDIINSRQYKDKSPLFIVKFISWNEFNDKNNDIVFPVFYAKTEGKCLATDNVFNVHK